MYILIEKLGKIVVWINGLLIGVLGTWAVLATSALFYKKEDEMKEEPQVKNKPREKPTVKDTTGRL